MNGCTRLGILNHDSDSNSCKMPVPLSADNCPGIHNSNTSLGNNLLIITPKLDH